MTIISETATFSDVAECTNAPGCSFEGGDAIPGLRILDSVGELTFVWSCPDCGATNETPMGSAGDPDYERDLEMEVA